MPLHIQYDTAIFDLFYGSLGIKWGSKCQKIVRLLATNTLNLENVSMLKYDSDVNFRWIQKLIS